MSNVQCYINEKFNTETVETTNIGLKVPVCNAAILYDAVALNYTVTS